MTLLISIVMVVIVAALVWSWWSARSGRDPATSVDHFHRALSAMQPEDPLPGELGEEDEDRH